MKIVISHFISMAIDAIYGVFPSSLFPVSVGDESVNKYVSSGPLSYYFSSLVNYFREQCIKLDGLVSEAAK